jgi:hypothetical protein
MKKEPLGSGCTVGVIHIPGGILFFKNRDLSGEHLAHRITVVKSTADSHMLQGVNLKTKAIEGVSIGVNRQRICVANTHILSTTDVTYDLLCEQLLHRTRTRHDVPRLVQEFMTGHTLQGGRILVASPEWAFLVEVLGDRYEMQAIDGDFCMTNTFTLLPHTLSRSEVREQSSLSRLQAAGEMMQAVSGLGALKAMLRSHLPEKGELSICNHRQDGGGTESSHIIHIQGEYVGWSSLVGFPCENDYHSVQLFAEPR